MIIFLQWIVDNKEWLFSGVGVTIIGWIFINLYKKNLNTKTTLEQEKTINVYYHQEEEQKEISLETNNEIYSLVDRFVNIFQSHGVSINQISSFVDPSFNLKISDFKDKDSILNILNDDLLEWTCDTFGIEREWLDGRDNRKYPNRDYYKNIFAFLRFLVELKKEYNNEIDIYMFKTGDLNPEVYGTTYVMILIRIPIKKINRRSIHRYIPVTTNWDWGYWRSRYQLKSIIYFINRLNIYTQGYDLSEEYDELSGGYAFPETVINNLKLGYTWYPEDYIDLPSQSIQAKETNETEKVRSYIEEEGYLKFFNKLLNHG